MAGIKVSDSARIVDILETLDKPVDYLRGVFGNMIDVKRAHGSASVRIGTTGRGIAPHYRVEPDAVMLDDLDLVDGNPDRHYVAFHGRNHSKLDWGSTELQDAHWSSVRMTCDEVQSCLGELRKRQKDAPRRI